MVYDRADKSIRSQLDLIETDPEAALHSMMTDVVALQGSARGGPDSALGVSIAALQSYLATAMEKGGLKRAAVEQYLVIIGAAREGAPMMETPAAATPGLASQKVSTSAASAKVDAFII